MKIEPNRCEIIRYMGCRKKDCSAELLLDIENAVKELDTVISPRSVYRKFDIIHNNDGSMDIGNMHILSNNLKKNLKTCASCYLMGATLGIGPDHLIQRSEISRISRTLLYQAASAAMIEAYCNEINAKIIDQEKREGRYCRPRFSPGYGDFDISFQRNISDMLQLPKTTGINLTASLMMMPSKSVTAIIGVSDIDSRCIMEGCEICSKRKDCAFRRDS